MKKVAIGGAVISKVTVKPPGKDETRASVKVEITIPGELLTGEGVAALYEMTHEACALEFTPLQRSIFDTATTPGGDSAEA